MKKIFLFSALVCLLLTSAVFAQQKAANFAGSWELDQTKSKLPERMRIESMTLNVAQTDKELKVEINVKRAPRPEGEMPNGGNGGAPPMPDGGRGNRQSNGTGSGMGGGRGGMMGGGNGIMTYNLDGSLMVIKSETPNGMPPTTVSVQAKTESDGKLTLTSTRSFETQNGAMSVKTTDIWELLDGGATLKVARETESMRGSQTSEMYFTKKTSTDGGMIQSPASSTNETTAASGQGVKQISKGVLNTSAISLVKPAYPAEARESRASGAVNVQVVIDEQGNVLSAKAVSGDPKLRAASEDAARSSKFAPTVLSGVPVKVTGVIIYNFVP
jgi:TonB family protein